jgi:2',3'-cyclic-nucleotide 2'-phosphodiesterase (5'-nucleotidase family)
MRSYLRNWLALAGLSLVLVACATAPGTTDGNIVTISVMGTNDVHGELSPRDNHGGLVGLSGYVTALREARERDGAVLLVDAGDMWQGTLDSNLTEGADVVAAYNAIGFDAATIGNHEFDFGPVGPKFIPEAPGDDPQGALRRNLAALQFPVVAANLIDEATGRPVAWQNVSPSTIVDVDGVRFGLIGVMTEEALSTTIAPNTVGLRVAPLVPAITGQAKRLREAGADIVVVMAHAGGRCTAFDDPHDLSSCNMSAEIMHVAEGLEPGLVDLIVAGHRHQGIAHIVNGIAITSSYSNTYAFSRVDFTYDLAKHAVVARHIFPPQRLCGLLVPPVPDCPDKGGRYAGEKIKPMPAVVAIARKAQERAAAKKAEPLGIVLDTPITMSERAVNSPLANLMTDAVREESGADISIHNVHGGIRATLPPGELTFGSVFRMFPFDNRLVVLDMSGADLRRIIATQAHNTNRWAGFSGMRVFVDCDGGDMHVRMQRDDGRVIADGDTLKVAVNDFLVLGGDNVLTPVTPKGGYPVPEDGPMVRDLLVDWFREHGGHISADDFIDPAHPRWNLPQPLPDSCSYSAR